MLITDAEKELPPRARRILCGECEGQTGSGTTSACAENTLGGVDGAKVYWNYLRVRGEYVLGTLGEKFSEELPPRARRIPPDEKEKIAYRGTTSACAENTWGHLRQLEQLENYLRVRGEYGSWRSPLSRLVELPPRARRIQQAQQIPHFLIGTTSACAENTDSNPLAAGQPGNYLRVRGEYVKSTTVLVACLELPPRARRIPHERSPHRGQRGTTSACAENTMSRALSKSSIRNYLRVRGEYRLM